MQSASKCILPRGSGIGDVNVISETNPAASIWLEMSENDDNYLNLILQLAKRYPAHSSNTHQLSAALLELAKRLEVPVDAMTESLNC